MTWPMTRRSITMVTSDAGYLLDAHAHLGNFAFHRHPEQAIRHFEVGVRIGELSPGERTTTRCETSGERNLHVSLMQVVQRDRPFLDRSVFNSRIDERLAIFDFIEG